jgi:hypothetical protein
MENKTDYKQCKYCGELIIITILSYLGLRRKVITTNCKCNGRNKSTRKISRFK